MNQIKVPTRLPHNSEELEQGRFQVVHLPGSHLVLAFDWRRRPDDTFLVHFKGVEKLTIWHQLMSSDEPPPPGGMSMDVLTPFPGAWQDPNGRGRALDEWRLWLEIHSSISVFVSHGVYTEWVPRVEVTMSGLEGR